MRVTDRERARIALGIAAVMLGLSTPPIVTSDIARADRTRDTAAGRGARASLLAQAAMRQRWRPGAMFE